MKNNLVALLDRVIIICSVVFIMMSYQPIIKTIESGRDYLKVSEEDYHTKYLKVEFSRIFDYEIEDGTYRVGTLSNGKNVIIANEKLVELPESNYKTGALFMINKQGKNNILSKFEEAGIQVEQVEDYIVIIADNPYRITLVAGVLFVLGIVGLLYEIIKKIKKKK